MVSGKLGIITLTLKDGEVAKASEVVKASAIKGNKLLQ